MSIVEPASEPPVLSHTEIARVGELLYRWTGMIFGANKRYYVERRIAERMRVNGFAAIAPYLGFLQSDAVEREEVINAFTINETYFYREEHQLAALSKDVLPQIIRTKRPGDLVRIWSMPCSTGEEAYSIAIWLLENWSLVDAYHVEIMGSDIDTAAIGRAMDGYFSERSLNRLPDAVRETYFEPQAGHSRRIIGDLRESVRFTQANIIDAASMTGLGSFDVILCRNLLIYFDDAARRRAVENMFASLNPGGFVFLGHSESMGRISDRFTLARFPDAIVYRRP